MSQAGILPIESAYSSRGVCFKLGAYHPIERR